MVIFNNPTMYKMASGQEYLELTSAGTWESFPSFANKFLNQIGARVVRKVEAPDIHLWEIEYEGSILNFVYDDFPNGVSIEPITPNSSNAINKLFKLVSAQANHNGL